jgi:hypothetical protein
MELGIAHRRERREERRPPAFHPAEQLRAQLDLGQPESESLDAQTVDKLADLVADLRIGEVLGRESTTDYGLDQPVLTLTVDRRGGEPIEYTLGKSPDEGEYTLKASIRPEYFRLPSFRARPLLEAAKRDALIQAADETAAGEESKTE